MKGHIRVFLIDPDESSREATRRAFAATGRASIVEESSSFAAGQARIAAVKADLIVVGLDADRAAGLRLVESVATASGPGPAVIPAGQARDSSLLISVMRAGAREYLSLPPRPGEMDGLVDRIVTAKAAVGGDDDGRKGVGMIALAGAVGGVGCTTIAVNTAVSLARVDSDVLLVDLDLLYGAVDIALDMLPDYTLTEAVSRIDRVDESLLKRAIARHASGIQVLPRPPEIEDAARIDPDTLRRLLGIARGAFSTIVVDASKSLQSTDFVAYEMADVILVVVQLDLVGLRNTSRMLKLFRQDEALASKLKLVANRAGAFPSEISKAKATESLGATIDWFVPNSSKILHDARCRGVPIATAAAGSKIHQAILDIAHGLRPPTEPAPTKKRRGPFAALF